MSSIIGMGVCKFQATKKWWRDYWMEELKYFRNVTKLMLTGYKIEVFVILLKFFADFEIIGMNRTFALRMQRLPGTNGVSQCHSRQSYWHHEMSLRQVWPEFDSGYHR